MKPFFDYRSLLVQMITAIVTVVILTSIAVGIPAIWLLHNQLDRQAWAQVEQGQLVTIELYDFHYKEILNLALLTAQRPTLHELLIQNDIPALTDYLTTLQSGAGLDRIMVCDPGDQLVAITGEPLQASVCQTWKTGIYQQDEVKSQVCMTAHHPIEGESGYLGDVFVCRTLDSSFTRQLSDQTGLEHILWINETPVSASFSESVFALQSFQSALVKREGDTAHRIYEIRNIPYYAVQIPLNENGLIAEVALNVADIFTARTRLAVTLISSILVISIFGSVFGVLLARRVGQPLVRLSESAMSFSQGDLETPVKTASRVNEITQVAKTLESARVDLLAMMTSLQNERDWSDHLLASVVEGIVTVNDEGEITFFSHGAERITGWRKTEVMGHQIDEIFQLENREKPFSSILNTSPSERRKMDVRLADDRIASLAITSARLARSASYSAERALVFRDISEEEAIHRLLGSFLANVAHEFRTPLSALEASIELLLDQAPDLTPDELHELHLSLHLGTLGLRTLVDNLLESANIEGRRFYISPRTAELGKIIADAVQTMQPLFDKYEQHLTVETPIDIPFVRADPRRTVQVLINLLSNASRYGPPAEEIILQVTKGAQFARLAVIDRGPGIPQAQQANIFKRFVYPHTDDAISQAGAGLGLSVVKAIVDAHGGQLGVDDHTGGGSIFWFTLPIAEEPI